MDNNNSAPGKRPEDGRLRLLILGGSLLQIPAVNEAKKMGIEVAVLDYDPECPGRALADRFYPESTVDQEAVLRCAREFQPEAIITLGTDRPMRSVAYASEALGLRSITYAAACRATNKYDMIEALAEAGVDHPIYLYFDPAQGDISALTDKIPYPCVVKPLDSSGSRGVILVKQAGELERAINYSSSYSSRGDVIIEEFMEGPEVSVEVIILQGRPRVLSITDKTTTREPHFVETMHVQPSSLSFPEQEAIRDLAVKSCTALNLNMGTAHVEIIVTKDGAKIVEVGPRMGGDYITTHLVPLSTGINMTRLMIEEALGMDPVLPQMIPGAACIRYMDQRPGIFREVRNLDKVIQDPHVVEAGIFVRPGKEISSVLSSVHRLGYIITRGATAKEALEANLKAHSKLEIIME